MENEPWQQLAGILQANERRSGLRCAFPNDNTSYSLLDALARPDVAATKEHGTEGTAIHQSLSGLLKQLAVFESISRCPILAVTGLLNAGKSSLLATYLSPANRGRVLRGLGNDAGTHRFVLWLPKIWWDDSELLTTLISFLASLFGNPPEHLSDDPDEAALQYNGRIETSALMHSRANDDPAESVSSPSLESSADPLNVPLIAYDQGLDSLKLGLIDCPDIQTGFLTSYQSESLGSDLAAARRNQLEKIGRLCSAFVVVSKLGSLHDQGLTRILTTLRDAMPGVPRLLAVNKVKSRYSPEVVYEQARSLVDRFGIESVFTAYDYRSALAHSRIPAMPSRMVAANESVQEEPLPLFFETTLQTPASSGESQSISYLFDLGDRLDAGTLSRESSRSLLLQLKARVGAAVTWFGQNQELQETRIKDAWQSIADACYEFMAERDASGRATGLRLQTSPTIIAQMADSLHRTAPIWMRISLSIDRTARQLHQAIASSTARFKILQSASESVTQFTKRFRRGEGAQVVTPQRLADALRGSDLHNAFSGTDQERLVANCSVAMTRFADEDKTELNAQELDAWSRQVWAGMSFKDKLWKGTQPLAVVMAPLLAAVLVPIDGGGTAVLVFASTKELLAAAGIAAVMTPMATGGETLSIVHRETPWRQLSDLFAILCDSIGLPRPDESELPTSKCVGGQRQLLACVLDVMESRSPTAVRRWELNEQLVKELQETTLRLP